MSNARKRGEGAVVNGRWFSPYKLHLYFGVGNVSAKGYVYSGVGGIMLRRQDANSETT